MIDSDKPAFAEMFTACCFNYGRDAAKETMRLWWSLLVEHDFQTVANAFQAHIRSSSRMPTINDLLDLITASNPAMRRPGADEAWAKLPRSEDDSVIWTEETAHAWGIASNLVNPHLVDRPDWVAARMAFKDAYQRAVESAKANGKPVKWVFAKGHTNDNLLDVVREAVQLGRITEDDARPLLAEIEHQRPMVAGLIEGTKGTADEARRNQFLAKLRAARAGLTETSNVIDLDAIRAECEAKDRELAQQDVRKAG